jgi:dTDP-glucose 4,6-dehydratase
MQLLVTGGAGFIGSNFVRYMLGAHPDCRVRVFDKLTYAGSLDNLADVQGDARFEFVQGDVCDADAIRAAMQGVDVVVHMAAESHNDRAILGPETAMRTNYMGTFHALEAARDANLKCFLHVATDEVYGAKMEGKYTEKDALEARSPYAASKAGGDRLAYAYFITYGVPTVITRPSNNYGPYQFPEKLIPFFTYLALRDENLPVYGNGLQMRDWLHVQDHCRAMDTLIAEGQPGEAYNIAGDNEHTNIETIRVILSELGKPETLIKHVEDRPGHDIRYPIDGSKLHALGWRPEVPWEAGVRETVRWFAGHREWMDAAVERGREFKEKWYKDRG